MKISILLTVLLFASQLVLKGQEVNALFTEGVQTYTQAEQSENPEGSRELLQSAVEKWQAALEQGHSAALHYNLGNAYARLDEPGLAILHYEKALALNPQHAEALANLNYVRKAHEMPAVETYNAFHHEFSVDTWAWIGSAAFWIFVGMIALPRIFGRPTALTRLFALLSFLILLTCGYALTRLHFESQRGVILVDETPLNIAPAQESEARGFAQAGTRAAYQDRHGDYYLVKTENEAVGWTDGSHFAPIWED